MLSLRHIKRSMTAPQLHALFIQIGLMLVAWAMGYLARRLGQPTVLGELLGGVGLRTRGAV
jgi:Kef-type K+ transport system membrane component KefB